MPPVGQEKKVGGAEAHARSKQYEYKANSSLVVTSDNRTRDSHEPSGEPESLWGRMTGKMGDKVQFSKPEGLEERKRKLKKKREENETEVDIDGSSRRSKKASGVSVLDVETFGFYRPRTRPTRDAYEALLNVIKKVFGDQPEDVTFGAADEILEILKNDRLQDPERQRECELLLGTISTDTFARLVAIGKSITDFVPESERNQEGGETDLMETEYGVAVEFEDEDEEEEEKEIDEIMESDDDQEDTNREEQDIEGRSETAMKVEAEVDESGQDGDKTGLTVQEIDAYWLQRRISKSFEGIDANASQKLAEQVFEALQDDDGREVENRLVSLLDFDKFDLIKELVVNRLKIVWCMKLARAQDSEEKAKIEMEMSNSSQLSQILDALKGARSTARERQTAMERSIREEARRLKSKTGPDSKTEKREDVRSGRTVLDLDKMNFSQGGHFMSNRSCQLPEGSYRTVQKGYEEIHIPAPKQKPFKSNEKLVKISEMPDWTHSAFSGMKTLNRIQSRVYESALFSAENLLLCAPTGAGKTNVAMLAILHQIGRYTNPDGVLDKDAFKIVYVAPMKALVAEMVGNFGNRLKEYGVTVKELTGDINLSRAEIEETQIIVTTPEKWDIITRKSGDRTYTNLVRLLIIDEIHLLHDTRGPVLESIVARTLRHIEATQELIRIVALSATLPNYEDVASLLRVKKDKGLFYFDNSFRPCPLAQQYIGVTIKKPFQRFQMMNEICYEKVMQSAGQHQVLVFVHSRKETAKTARFIKQKALADDSLIKFIPEDSASREILETEAEACKDLDLKDLLPFGIAIHHAGMSRVDRTLVEDLFSDGHVQVLISTATLAWGVNLPAHTVVIKGTQVYNPQKGAWDELDALDVMQMFGRAGRPQYDSYGEGVIITGRTELQFYLSLFNQQLAIESQLISALPNALNAEMVLGTVQNIKDAVEWMGYTYLYIRMLKNPELYSVPLDAPFKDPTLKEQMMDLCHTAAILLDRNNLIKYDRRTEVFQVTDLGRIASHYYVSYTTIATFNQYLKPTMGEIDICRLFSLSDEFKDIVVREEEKLELVKLIERVPIPVKESIEEPSAKINVLLQAYISNLKLEGLALMSDMVYITQSASRLMRCIFEISMKRGWASVADKSLNLCKAVQKRMWASQTPLRQFPTMPKDILVKLEKKDLPWDRYYDLSSQELGELIRQPRMGKMLHRLIHQFPRIELAAQIQPITRSVLKIDLTITPDFQWEDTVHGFVEPFWIIVEDQDSEQILHHEYFLLKKQFHEIDTNLAFTVSVFEPLPPQYFVKVVSDKWLSCENVLPISFRNLILPEKFPSPTELLDLQPLPVSALKDHTYQKLYSDFTHFNPIQTQVFNSLYTTDDNCLVAAPSGSGKTVCAEFAILRALMMKRKQVDEMEIEDETTPVSHSSNPQLRCVYIAPFDSVVTTQCEEWKHRFGGMLELNVVELTGETAVDLKLLEKGNVICSTPEKWDMLSRRWKQRKNVQNIDVFIVDELHLIGGIKGPIIEVITSRMRYIASELEKKIRIVGLSTSVANARDLGEWIGVTSHSLFNFATEVRPVPLEITINGFDIANFDSRMQAMSRPCYSNISLYGTKKPVIVFVPTRKHARLTTLDLLMHAAADGDPTKFLQCEASELDPWLVGIKEAALKHSLKYGIAFLHESMSPHTQHTVLQVFKAGLVQVLVSTSAMCWSVYVTCHLVIVMGTQSYEGSGGSGGTDYPVTDLLQMMGRASRPLEDQTGRCVLMCHGARKEYYKKFLFEAFPVESHLDHFLGNHFTAEIVTKTIENKQDAVDYLTWTFFYRRLAQNPNYYHLQGVTHRHLSDHLSDLVETTLAELEQSKVIMIEDEMDLSPLNLGMISAYYYVNFSSIELFSASLTEKTKMKGLIEILSAASEFDDLPVRAGEDEVLRSLLLHAPIAIDQPKYTDPHVKVNALLQSHFSRTQIGTDLQLDQSRIVVESIRLIQAIVDVIASNGWLSPALAAMEISQMVTQALWDKDPSLLQIPHFNRELCKKLTDQGLESVFDLVDLDQEKRADLLKMSEKQLDDVDLFCSRYPDIQLNFEVLDSESISADDPVKMTVMLERETKDSELRPVDAPRFPKRKDEGWWLVVGIPKQNQLLAIKRVSLQQRSVVKLDFTAPSEQGSHSLTLFFMCDSYLGCDQEYEFSLDVKSESSSDVEMEQD
eukprot:g5333.t1